MMPFSLFRMWILGMFGWFVLGLGIYWIYQATLATRPLPRTEVAIADDRRPQPDETVAITRNGPRQEIDQVDRSRTAYLLLGITCVLLSTISWVPVSLVRSFVVRDELPQSFQCPLAQDILRPDGSVLHVEHCGPETPLTLVFTHGWSLDHTEWSYVRQALGNRYRMLFWDLAGLGNSKGPDSRDFSLEKMATDLDAILNQCTQGPVVLVGHSIGGMIQQTFCRLFPEQLHRKVKGIVFVHTTYTNPTHTVVGSALVRALEGPVLRPLHYLTIPLAPLLWLANWQSYWNGSLHLTTRFSSFAGSQTWQQIDYSSRLAAAAWPSVVARGNLAMTHFDEQAILPEIDVPALVVAGADDRLTKPEASQVLARNMPRSQLVIMHPAGHLGHWEQNAKFHAALSEFVDSLDLESSSPPAPSPIKQLTSRG